MSDPPCDACAGVWPLANHFIADLGLSLAYLHDDQFFPGWTVLLFKRHATELFHLAPTERIQLMEEVSRLAKVLAETFPKKNELRVAGQSTASHSLAPYPAPCPRSGSSRTGLARST